MLRRLRSQFRREWSHQRQFRHRWRRLLRVHLFRRLLMNGRPLQFLLLRA